MSIRELTSSDLEPVARLAVRPRTQWDCWDEREVLACERRQAVESLAAAEGVLAIEEGRIVACAAWVSDRFESEILGREVAKIVYLYAESNWGRRILEAARERLAQDFVQGSVRLDSSQTVEVEALLSSGATQVDSIVTFASKLTDEQPPVGFRVATRDDAERVAQLAATAFIEGRYFSDPAIEREEAEKLYAKWAENACCGLYGAATIVSEDLNCFMIVSVRKDLPERTGVLVLAAVSEQVRGQGMGKHLWAASRAWLANQSCSAVLVGTQAANTRAVGMYEKLGMALVRQESTFAWSDRRLSQN